MLLNCLELKEQRESASGRHGGGSLPSIRGEGEGKHAPWYSTRLKSSVELCLATVVRHLMSDHISC